MTSVEPSLSSGGSDAVQDHSTSSAPYELPWFVQRITSTVCRAQTSGLETHLSCGMADTRRWLVCLLARSVRDCTSESRIASFGLAFAVMGTGVRRRPRRDGRRG